jgi:hypothetical protein
MKLLRTIRLDPSDTFVFEKAAEAGEWAVPGSFVFWTKNPDLLEGKARSAFRAGFLGLESLGWSTLVQIVDVTEEDRAAATEMLAQQLMDSFGAPDLTLARLAAAEEIAYAASLCDHPLDTLIAIHRVHENDSIRETFRTLRPREGAKPLRAFSFLDAEGADESVDEIDLSKLAQGGHEGRYK